jgi:hypothetical protein
MKNKLLKGSLLLAGLLLLVASKGMAQAPSAEKFRLLFYGQSITQQPWAGKVAAQLKAKYPNIEFEVRNPAIGGFTSPSLIRTAEHDLYPWYPDLLIFHVYGPWEEYEAIIRNVRERTTAAIVIQTDHVDVDIKDPSIENSHETQAARQKEIAAKYGCFIADVNAGWREHLQRNALKAKDLLGDHIHPNARGNEVMATLVFDAIKDLPVFSNWNSAAKTTVPLTASDVTREPDGSLGLRFRGNRVEAAGSGQGAGTPIEILLDGRPVAAMKECWAATRPSLLGNAFKFHWMPALKQVSFEKAPLEEDWTLTCVPDSDPNGKPVRFKVTGSVTGEDGEGRSDERFVSTSGRVVIEPRDWMIANALGVSQISLPAGYSVTWKTYPLFANQVPVHKMGEHFLLIQGMNDSMHSLVVRQALSIGGFRVMDPSRLQERVQGVR